MPMPSKLSRRPVSLNYEEYMAGEPENNDLPSTFLSDEDMGRETNVMILPNLNINLDLKVQNYTEMISKCKTKTQIENVLHMFWDEASSYGALSEKIDRLQDDFESIHFDIEGMAAFGINLDEFFMDDEDY